MTGGAGTIGSTLVDQLVDAEVGHVDVLDNLVRGRRANLDDALASGKVTLVEGDIRDRDLVHDVTRGKDVVFHQAAIRITQCAEEPRLALEVLVDGTFNVYEAAVAHGVNKVVAASSASVYGMAEEFPTSERHHHHNNDTFYGAAKSFNEGMLRSFRAMYGLDYVLLRYFNVYGPRMDVHGLYTEVLVRWMERIVDGQPPLIFGDGLQTMDFVYTTDIARANVLAAASDVTEGVYNVASGAETSLLELAEALLRVMGSDLPVEHGPERAVNGVVRRLADTSAARARPRLRRRRRPRGGSARARRVVAPLREEIAAGPQRGDPHEPHQRDAAMAGRRGGRRGHRGDRVRLGRPGTTGRRVRAALRRDASRPSTPSPSPAAPPHCTWRSSLPASAPATTWSCRRSRSSPPPTRRRTSGPARCSPTSTP